MKKSLYEVLECESRVSVEVLRQNYRRLALQHHPDKNASSNESKQQMLIIQNAWEILRDPERRLEYDLKLQKEREDERACESIGLEESFLQDHSICAPCRCGTMIRIDQRDFLAGFSKIECSACSCRFEFAFGYEELMQREAFGKQY